MVEARQEQAGRGIAQVRQVRIGVGNQCSPPSGGAGGPAVPVKGRAAPTGPGVLTPEEVIGILRLDQRAPRSAREALRNLVRRGKLACLRSGPGRHGRMVFLRRHVEECLARWEQWGLER